MVNQAVGLVKLLPDQKSTLASTWGRRTEGRTVGEGWLCKSGITGGTVKLPGGAKLQKINEKLNLSERSGWGTILTCVGGRCDRGEKSETALREGKFTGKLNGTGWVGQEKKTAYSIKDYQKNKGKRRTRRTGGSAKKKEYKQSGLWNLCKRGSVI